MVGVKERIWLVGDTQQTKLNAMRPQRIRISRVTRESLTFFKNTSRVKSIRTFRIFSYSIYSFLLRKNT